jgi:mono/diheme cytochrome c family protein
MRALVAAAALLALLSGCEKMVRNMYDQPRYKPMAASPLFADGSSARPPVPGTLAASDGVFAGASSGRVGADAVDQRRAAQKQQSLPAQIPLAMLERGRERFDIYCSPCHSPVGDGDGRVAQRGFPHPPSFHTDKLRSAADRHFYDVITNGYGLMSSYAGRVPPQDRWAIVAYIRALQLSQHVKVGDAK